MIHLVAKQRGSQAADCSATHVLSSELSELIIAGPEFPFPTSFRLLYREMKRNDVEMESETDRISLFPEMWLLSYEVTSN